MGVGEGVEGEFPEKLFHLFHPPKTRAMAEAGMESSEEAFLQEVQELAARMMSDDADTAAESVEELVECLSRAVDSDRCTRSNLQELLGTLDCLRSSLVNLLCTGMEDIQFWACQALSHIAYKSTVNIARIGKTPRVFDGLLRCLEGGSKGAACGVLSQLAFCNTYNSTAIANTEGLLAQLVTVMLCDSSSDRQAATCALSNCAANSKQVALQIASVDGTMDALKAACQHGLSPWLEPHTDTAGSGAHAVAQTPMPTQHAGVGVSPPPEHVIVLDEEVHGDDDDGELTEEDDRTVISAIGCMDNLSHCPEVRERMVQEELDTVLLRVTCLQVPSDTPFEGLEVITAESAMILTRLLHPERLEALVLSPRVLRTIAHCTQCAIDRKHWANFAWRLADVLEPLARLSACPSYRRRLHTCGAVLPVLRATAVTRLLHSEEGALERLHHCVIILCFLGECLQTRKTLSRALIGEEDLLWFWSSAADSVASLSRDSLEKTHEVAGATKEWEGVGQDGRGLAGAAENIGVAASLVGERKSPAVEELSVDPFDADEGSLGVCARNQVEWGLTGPPRKLRAVDLLAGLESVEGYSAKSEWWVGGAGVGGGVGGRGARGRQQGSRVESGAQLQSNEGGCRRHRPPAASSGDTRLMKLQRTSSKLTSGPTVLGFPASLWCLRPRTLALCMGQQPRLGKGSLLRLLDAAMLREIIEESCVLGVAAAGLVHHLSLTEDRKEQC